MKNSNPLDSFISLTILNIRLERLYLKLLSTSSWNLHIIVFVEHYRHVVEVTPVHLLPSINRQNLLLLGVEVKPIAKKRSQVRISSEDQEVNTEHPVNCSQQVLKINLSEVSDLKLNTSRNEYLSLPLLNTHHLETILYSVEALSGIRLAHQMLQIRQIINY